MNGEKQLKAPCPYQGGKQRLASQIVDTILERPYTAETQFFDLCCGSGAISLELVNRGISPRQITMYDAGVWGKFWASISSNTFDLQLFRGLIQNLPESQEFFKTHLRSLIDKPANEGEVELFLLLQATSFGGKQIRFKDGKWCNTSFRNYWKPTETSKRRSPVNAMQPFPSELERRVLSIVENMVGVKAFNNDIMSLLEKPFPTNSIVYIDPPYQNTTGYEHDLQLSLFIKKFKSLNNAPLFVSEGVPLTKDAIALNFNGKKGGISGLRKGSQEEWLSVF